MKIVFTYLLIFFTSTIIAQNIEVDLAKQVARNYYFEKSRASGKQFYENENLTHTSTISYEGIPLLYIFNLTDKQGFIITSSTSKTFPVLAYSFEGSFDIENQPPAVKSMIDKLKTEVLYSIENRVKSDKSNKEIWTKYSSENFIDLLGRTKSTQDVSPLITTKWGQGCFYNKSCPEDVDGECGHALVGCAAVAMAQIMKYHNYPQTGAFSNRYYHNKYGYVYADFNAATYNWSNMPDEFGGFNSDRAQLLHHCGVSIDMIYGASSSGAYSTDVDIAFSSYFNYANCQYITKDAYLDEEWVNTIRNELSNARPVFYVGSGSVGHAFVVDGYQENGFFHINWGWDGYYNGYYHLSDLNPAELSFSEYQAAIIGIQPNYNNCCTENNILTSSFDALSDGSGSNNYANNANCQWLIQPENSLKISLNFSHFNTEEETDVLNVYDGDSPNAPLIGSFSGQTIPEEILSSSNTLFLDFNTDNENTDAGWLATYETYSCKGRPILRSPSGTITDGSGDVNYTNNLDCLWLIKPDEAASITLSFSEFATEAEYDKLSVYDGSSTQSPLLGSFHGENLPPQLTSTGGSMLLRFQSDGAVSSSGWSVMYSSDIILSIQDPTIEESICLYPNPVSDVLYLETYNEIINKVCVYNTAGQLIKSVSPQGITETIDFSEISKGIYLVKIEFEDRTITKKIIKN